MARISPKTRYPSQRADSKTNFFILQLEESDDSCWVAYVPKHKGAKVADKAL